MKLLAIDGNSILNRAFYGIRPLSNTRGVYTNAIFGFMNIYLKQVAGPIQSVVVAYAYFVLLLYFIGLRKNERQYVNSLIRNKLLRKH